MHIYSGLTMELKQIGVAGNGATFYFLVFAILAGVVGVASKLASASHVRVWRNDSLAAASSSLSHRMGHHCPCFWVGMQGDTLGGIQRMGDLGFLEAFIIILTLTQLIYVVLLHAGMFSGKYGPGYTDPDYGHEPAPKGTGLVTLSVVLWMYVCMKIVWFYGYILYIYIYLFMRKYGIKLNLSLVFDTIFDTVIPSQKKS
ncbi:hypothetical protein DsansV1_C22g0173881 [Dioscorea sansibarensis]